MAAMSALASVPEAAESVKARWALGNLAEQRVRFAGLRRLREELVSACPEPAASRLLEMPRRADGSPHVMQASFFKRLLSDRLEIKGCLESDISAAHLDLKHLSAEQLLVIRTQNQDFLSSSESHTAHGHFLEALDACLAEKVARHLLRCRARPGAMPAKPSALRALGRRIILTLGAAELLAAGWGTTADGHTAEVPERWAIELEADAWPGRRAALLETRELQLQIPAGEQCPELSWRAVRGQVAVVCDSSSGTGRGRRFQWEITLVDPRKSCIPSLMIEGLQQRLQKDSSSVRSLTNLPRPLRAGLRSLRATSPDGLEAASSGRRTGGRCPRESVAFLDGRVAGAIARMEAAGP
mmetsp:Transcript_101898/g.318462  ORF Transcript_101898/g.318462 Transcript_101898/m.318462 type:complete len:355 (+) Transcript_101898:40-1104(+)